jgi:hypothetical protein
MAARRMNLAFVPTNSRRVFFFRSSQFARHKMSKMLMSRMLNEFVDPDPDRTAAALARAREEPEDEDDEDDDDKQDQDDDEDDDGNSGGYSE